MNYIDHRMIFQELILKNDALIAIKNN